MEVNEIRLGNDIRLEEAEQFDAAVQRIVEAARQKNAYPAALVRMAASVKQLSAEFKSFDPRTDNPEELERRAFMIFFGAAAAVLQDVSTRYTSFIDFPLELQVAHDDLMLAFRTHS